MTELSIQELERTAEAYERRLVPAVFEECAHRLLDAAGVRAGQHVLDVACGTGIVARAATERIGTDGSVTGVDINPGMLAVARRLSPDIPWHEGSVEALPFDDESFDVALCQFGLMFFPAPETALREMARVLTPEGRLAIAVFDSVDRQPLYRAMAEVYEKVIHESAGDAGRGPFVMGDKDKLAELFSDSGISTAAISTCEPKVRFPSARDLVLAEVEGWFPFAQIRVDRRTLNEVIREVERVVTPFLTPDGTIEAPIPVHLITATKSSNGLPA